MQLIARLPRETPLLRGRLVSRYKRFFADVELDTGELVVAHCVNTGAMEGLVRPGIPVWLSRATNPARKLAFTWELAEVDGRRWGVNTALPNKLVATLLAQRHLPWLAHWQCIRAEKKYGVKSRVDFWLCDYGAASPGELEKSAKSKKAAPIADPLRQHYLEVKNCHLLYPDGIAYFPDCKSERATGHLEELVGCLGCVENETDAASGKAAIATSAEVLFVVQVPGAVGVRPSDMHDPTFAAAARKAAASGVRFSAIGVEHTDTEIKIYGPLSVDLEPYDLAPHQTWRSANQN